MCCRNHDGSSQDGSTLDVHEHKTAKEDSVVNNLITIDAVNKFSSCLLCFIAIFLIS